jgi:hypothetical protein
MVQCPIQLLYIIKGPIQVISGLFRETWGYFCMKNFISTTRNCHSHIYESTHFILFALLKVPPRFFPRLACGPPNLMGPVCPTPPPSHPVSGPGCAPQTTCLGNIRPQATPIESDSTIIPPLRTRGKWFIYRQSLSFSSSIIPLHLCMVIFFIKKN